MPLYANGRVDESVLVEIGRGTDSNGLWRWLATPATVARFRFAQQYALDHFGREIGIRDGYNMYRPLFSQEIARRGACAAGNCNGAAVPGSSSHGGSWYYDGAYRDCLAIDIDPNGLTWAQAQAACAAAGFAVGLITERISGIPGGEPWHVIDFAAFGPAPTFGEAITLPTPAVPTTGDPDMSVLIYSGDAPLTTGNTYLLRHDRRELVVRPTLGLEAKALINAVPALPRAQFLPHEIVELCLQGGYKWDAAKGVGVDSDGREYDIPKA